MSVAGTGMALSKNIIQPVDDQIDLLGWYDSILNNSELYFVNYSYYYIKTN